MKRKYILGVSLTVLAILVIFSIPRQEPSSFLKEWRNAPYEIREILDIRESELGNYVIIKLRFDMETLETPTEHSSVKNTKKVKNLPGYPPKAEFIGEVYLVKNGLYSWEIVL